MNTDRTCYNCNKTEMQITDYNGEVALYCEECDETFPFCNHCDIIINTIDEFAQSKGEKPYHKDCYTALMENDPEFHRLQTEEIQ